jgi:hypothetical protein
MPGSKKIVGGATRERRVPRPHERFRSRRRAFREMVDVTSTAVGIRERLSTGVASTTGASWRLIGWLSCGGGCGFHAPMFARGRRNRNTTGHAPAHHPRDRPMLARISAHFDGLYHAPLDAGSLSTSARNETHRSAASHPPTRTGTCQETRVRAALKRPAGPACQPDASRRVRGAFHGAAARSSPFVR